MFTKEELEYLQDLVEADRKGMAEQGDLASEFWQHMMDKVSEMNKTASQAGKR